MIGIGELQRDGHKGATLSRPDSSLNGSFHVFLLVLVSQLKSKVSSSVKLLRCVFFFLLLPPKIKAKI